MIIIYIHVYIYIYIHIYMYVLYNVYQWGLMRLRGDSLDSDYLGLIRLMGLRIHETNW